MLLSITSLIILSITVNAPETLADVFTSVQHMESLYHRESRLLNELDTAILFFKETLHTLRQTRSRLSSWRGGRAWENARGVTFAPDHPVDAFTLVRRLARDWPLAVSLMTHSYQLPKDLMDDMNEGETEMGSALRGLSRLQTVYRLDTDQLADGIVGMAKANTTMTAADCLEMASWLAARHLFSQASTWAHTAQRRVSIEGDLTVDPTRVSSELFLLTNLAQCEPAEVSKNTTPKSLIPVMKQFPHLTLDATSTHLYNLVTRQDCAWYNELNALEEVDMNPKFHQAYNEMCYGSPKMVQGSCYYVNYHQKPLIIAPFKLEEINVDPPIVLVHDVISDLEIEEIKDVFLKVMVNCEVLQKDGSTPSTYRTCMRGWVQDESTPVAERLTRRIGQLANLKMHYSEHHQVASYGLGGEYKLHNDALYDLNLSATDPVGQRIGTVMLYLNEVAAGGYTVFPALRAAVAPVKGAAVVWFNMLPDGEEDERTLHGGCPVLLGSKWVLNKWIHEGGQDWVTHCPLDRHSSKKYFYL